jgi:phosphatidate cytidylyltransferase
VLTLAAVAQWELYRMFRRVGIDAPAGPGLVLGALVVLAFAFGGPSRPWLVPLALSVAVAVGLTLGLRRRAGSERDWPAVALVLLGVCYCAWLLGHAIWLRALAGGAGLTYLLVGVTWCGETAAYFVGRTWGRHRLAPRISPSKTVEGAVAQLAASVGVALLGGRLVGLAVIHGVGIGLLLGVVGQVGDLAESFLKRSAQTKDTGGLVPGHGGLLDRLDSLLFNVPALYYYVKVFM